MTLHRLVRAALIGSLLTALAACGSGIGSGDSGLFHRNRSAAAAPYTEFQDTEFQHRSASGNHRASSVRSNGRSSLFDLFRNNADPNTTVEVNKYIWNAALDVLNFLPIESVDPFTGVIVTGFGTPPGGGRAYRATIYVQDPALDARSLTVALVARGGGPVAAETQHAIEDAILTRARQLRIADSRL